MNSINVSKKYSLLLKNEWMNECIDNQRLSQFFMAFWLEVLHASEPVFYLILLFLSITTVSAYFGILSLWSPTLLLFIFILLFSAIIFILFFWVCRCLCLIIRTLIWSTLLFLFYFHDWYFLFYFYYKILIPLGFEPIWWEWCYYLCTTRLLSSSN